VIQQLSEHLRARALAHRFLIKSPVVRYIDHSPENIHIAGCREVLVVQDEADLPA